MFQSSIKHLEYFLHFPLPRDLFGPRHAFGGRMLWHWAPAAVLSFTSARAKTSTGLTFPGRAKREGYGNPHTPTVLPSVATAACPPRPPAWSFSQWSSAPVPQRAAGNRGLSPSLASAPHTRTFRHQWETARSVSIASFFGALRATFSTAICSLSPLWTMLLFKASDSSSFISSSPASPSSAFPPLPPWSLSLPNPMKWASRKRKLALLPHKAVLQPLWVLEFLFKNFFWTAS